MSKTPNIEINEYLKLLNIIKQRFEKHNQLFTKDKESILRILFENSEHLSVDEIVTFADYKFNIILKESIICRILSSFETLGIVGNIIIDDKKRFELIYFKEKF
jgi:Fe2+ or Zn2+ uptake regulation protein